MNEIARSGSRRSELEVSQLPEVAALATALTTLFNGLGIPQQRYAARVAMDKSTVSRYLNGRRVANQDFISRLCLEMERHRGVAVTEETRSRLFRLRMAALKVSDPQSFEVENLREEVDRSQRTIKQLRRQQEALELLLDQKEDSARESERQLELLRGDWIAERVETEASLLALTGDNHRFKDETESLRAEIADLKRQLFEVHNLRIGAETRCTRLKDQLADAEAKLADHLERQGDMDFPYSPADILNEVLLAQKEQRFNDAARWLSLAAAHFDGGDIASLWKRITRTRRGAVDGIRLLDDAIRFGSVDTVASIAEELLNSSLSNGVPNLVQTVATSIASSKNTSELLQLYHRWHGGGSTYGIIRTALPMWSEDAPPSDVFALLKVLHENKDSTTKVRVLHAYGSRSTRDVFNLSLLYHRHAPERFADETHTLVTRWQATLSQSGLLYGIKEWNSFAKALRDGKRLRIEPH
ncbi:hypothetical protein PV367_28670 [Streptomyces europaeiscabiei]|uniref:HTH cro/C1-type domain-containing protein n=1 Tax=Streptomyces europaeiscabiei TaxID=146819 RepID=A0AAJ2PUF8_9ACTN|nr:hypothetical protein [Streptomyces europaeiscabiei]MDX3133662.1 hypothetical protein [Streptomyces europaeiscabiei]